MSIEIKNKIENIIKHNGDWSGYALQNEINELLIMQLEKIKKLITAEINLANEHGQETARLTALYNKIINEFE